MLKSDICDLVCAITTKLLSNSIYPINDEVEAKDDADSILTIATFSDIFVLYWDVVLKIESRVFHAFQYKQAEKS